MKTKLIFCILLSFGFYNIVIAQKQHTKQHALWFRYSTTINLPKNFNIKSEIEERTLISSEKLKQHQIYWRTLASKEFKKNWTAGIGFAIWGNSTNDDKNSSKLIAPEFRPYFEVGYKNKICTNFTILHRYKVEARFQKNTNKNYTEIEDNFRKFARFRYQIGIEYVPFKKNNQDIRLRLLNEIMINAGKEISRNIFDQNRVIVAFQYKLNQCIALESSYIFWLQQNANGDSFINRHILRFSLLNTFEIKNKNRQIKK